MAHHIAQLNVGRTVAPLDTPQLADFLAWLDAINAIADASPGFVWRLQGESGTNTDLKAVFARRYEWFERADGPSMVLWWVPAGSTATVDDALARLTRLTKVGPTAAAFMFKTVFPSPDDVPAATAEATA